MRHVTTLFVALDMLIPHLNNGNVALVQAAFLVIIEAVRFVGGALRQFVLDDKGCVAILAWGLPRAAHGAEDDADRAIKCALGLQHGLHEVLREEGAVGKAVSGPCFGIAAGEAYVGLVGATQRCEYAMMGPSVNLSARLMGKAAPWQVLIDEVAKNNALLANPNMVFRAHPPVQAKGYDKEVPVFVPQVGRRLLTHSNTQRSLLSEFTESWGRMELRVQMVGKVASVLADSPEGLMIDFPFNALVGIVDRLKIANYAEAKSAVQVLQGSRCFRLLSRGAERGHMCCSFIVREIQRWVLGLLPEEQIASVKELYSLWVNGLFDRLASRNDLQKRRASSTEAQRRLNVQERGES